MRLTCDLHVDKEQIRLLACLNFLDYLKNDCLNNNDPYLAILGDIFHTSNNIKNQFFVPIFMKFLELKEAGINLYFIPGNHDIINKNGDGTLAETFSAFGTFIQKSETINVNGYNYDFLSYTEDSDEIPHNSDILLTHLSIEGFWPQGNVIEQSCFDDYNLVVSGHVHKYQQDGKFFFVGAPYSCNKGERTYRHGYAVIDGPSIKHYDYFDAPEYLTIKAENFNEDIDYTNKLVDVEISSKIENFTKLRNILYDKGALEVNPIFLKEEISQDTTIHTINKNEGVIKSAAKYLNDVKADGIDNNTLLECYKEVLKRIKQ